MGGEECFTHSLSILSHNMNLREEILREHSRKQTTKIVRWVGTDAERFKQVMQLFLKDEYRVVQRIAWVVSECSIAHPELIKPYFKKLTSYLAKEGTHPAVRRNILRIFQFVEQPEGVQGTLVDLCFRFLTSKDEPVAVKAFAITVLSNIAEENPELKPEVRMVIEQIAPYSSAAIRSRARCAMKALQ